MAKRVPKKDPLLEYVGEKFELELPATLGGNRALFTAYHNLLKLLKRKDGAVEFDRRPWLSFGQIRRRR